MKIEDILGMLAETLEDRRPSRGERQALREVLEDRAPEPEERRRLRNRAFSLAEEALGSYGGGGSWSGYTV